MTPTQAREYIAQFSKYTMKGTNCATFENGEKVDFNNMTDKVAIRVATGLGYIEHEAAETAVKQ